jgi:hypothetical protein
MLLSGNHVCGRAVIRVVARDFTGKFDIRFQDETRLFVTQSVLGPLALNFPKTAIREFVHRVHRLL